MTEACDECLRRSSLLSELAGHLDRVGSRLTDLLELEDMELIGAVGGGRQAELERWLKDFDGDRARREARSAGLTTICCCEPRYPERLLALPSQPAALYVTGDPERLHSLAGSEPVALVGTRRPSSYGLDVARALARSLAAAGLPVISGMAHGIDSAAHEGALSAEGLTVAVLPASPERPHPASRMGLHRRIAATGSVISDLPPGSDVWRWMFPARNRLIAGLAAITLVVEARYGSGALITARWAEALGRPIGAVPGRITSPQAQGPHRLLQGGAHLVTSAQDVLDILFGHGVRSADIDDRPPVDPELRRWLSAIADGHDTPAALARLGLDADLSLRALSSLELSGHIRREAGGRFTVLP